MTLIGKCLDRGSIPLISTKSALQVREQCVKYLLIWELGTTHSCSFTVYFWWGCHGFDRQMEGRKRIVKK